MKFEEQVIEGIRAVDVKVNEGLHIGLVLEPGLPTIFFSLNPLYTFTEIRRILKIQHISITNSVSLISVPRL